MKNLRFLSAFILLASFTNAQDSTKTLSHEVGFNAIRLLSQVGFLNSSGMAQLPYDVFYNLNYKDQFGIRIGAGTTSSYSEREIDKQEYPSITKSNAMNFRFGGNYNFSKHGRVTLNGFVDFLVERINMQTISSTTTQAFPNPVSTRYENSSTIINGVGFRAGTGIRFQCYKQLHLYFELPFTFVREKTKENNVVKETGEKDVTSDLESRQFASFFTLPATVYVVLKF